MVRHLLTGARITSTALRDFGVLRSIFCTITEGFPSIIFQCILKRWSTDSITGKRTYSNASSTSILVTFPTNYLNLITIVIISVAAIIFIPTYVPQISPIFAIVIAAVVVYLFTFLNWKLFEYTVSNTDIVIR